MFPCKLNSTLNIPFFNFIQTYVVLNRIFLNCCFSLASKIIYMKVEIRCYVNKSANHKHLLFWGTFEEFLLIPVTWYLKKIDWNDETCPQFSRNTIWNCLFSKMKGRCYDVLSNWEFINYFLNPCFSLAAAV